MKYLYLCNVFIICVHMNDLWVKFDSFYVNKMYIYIITYNIGENSNIFLIQAPKNKNASLFIAQQNNELGSHMAVVVMGSQFVYS